MRTDKWIYAWVDLVVVKLVCELVLYTASLVVAHKSSIKPDLRSIHAQVFLTPCIRKDMRHNGR